MSVKTQIVEAYVVSYGPEKVSERETKSFSDEDDAADFFRKKEALGMHVDVTHVITETKITARKLTKPPKR